MGLDNKETSVSVGEIIMVVGGKWTKRVPEGTEGAVERKLTKGVNEGKSVWEIGYANIEGHLVSVDLKKKDTGMSGIFGLRDCETGDCYTIDLPADNRYMMDIIKRLPTIDTAKPLRLSLIPSKTKKTMAGNPVTNMFVYQDGTSIKDYYISWKKNAGDEKATPTHSHGIPEPEETVTGLNFSRQENWLLEKFIQFISEFIPPVVNNAVPVPAADERPPVTDNDVPAEFDDSENVPF